ncbi:MAG TPA: hypothetical protein VK970_09340, partial [Candidatus Methylacidiphilales bacterium]|nr:hypothetical protein [Candidatus Methylacidiphilales bacterium]
NWNNRTFTLVELAPGSGTWQPLLPWMQLPEGVLVDAAKSSDFATSQPVLSVALNLPPCNGLPVSSSECAYQIFTPAGGLAESTGMATEPQILRLVPGMMVDGKLAPVAHSVNYYDVIINRYTGIAKVDRP